MGIRICSHISQICLLYIATDNTLAVQSFQAGKWSNSTSGLPMQASACFNLGVHEYTAVPGSGTLSTTYMLDNSTESVYLVYHSPDRGPRALVASPSSSNDSYTWKDLDLKSGNDRYGFTFVDESPISTTLSKSGHGVDFYAFGYGKGSNSFGTQVYTLQYENETWTGSGFSPLAFKAYALSLPLNSCRQ